MKELEITASEHSFGELYNSMRESGVHPEIAGHLVRHEHRHFVADNEKTGRERLGFVVGNGFIMAYYLVVDDRTPATLMAIASAPGYSEMSQGDWSVYNHGWTEFLQEQREKRMSHTGFGDGENKDIDPIVTSDDFVPGFINRNELTKEHLYHPGITKGYIINALGKRIDNLITAGSLPDFDTVCQMTLRQYLEAYGPVITKAYKEIIEEIESGNTKNSESPEKQSAEIPEKSRMIRLKYGDAGWWENLPPNFRWLEIYKEDGLPFEKIAPFLKTLTYEVNKYEMV